MKLRYELREFPITGLEVFDTEKNKTVAYYANRDGADNGVKEYNRQWLCDLGFEHGRNGSDWDRWCAYESGFEIDYMDNYYFGVSEFEDKLWDRLSELCESDPNFNSDCDSCGDALMENVSTWGLAEIVAIVESMGFGSDWDCECEPVQS